MALENDQGLPIGLILERWFPTTLFHHVECTHNPWMRVLLIEARPLLLFFPLEASQFETDCASGSAIAMTSHK